ncbi:MAG: 2-oxoglutarate and iron-dependent oxygenase domain-containing protein [Alphaproteobacteria bacterium]
MALQEVPVIDIAPFYDGGAEGRQRVGRAIDRACTDIGFLTIVGHRVPDDLVRHTYDVSKQFFDLPLDEKMRVKRPTPEQVRGYSPLCDEGLSYSLDEPTPGDLKESLTVGPVDVPADDPYFHGPEAGPHFAPNLWPARPADLKDTWIAYFRAMERLSADLMTMFAIGLGLPDTFFDKLIDRHISMFRVLNYPDQPNPPEKNQLRAGAHSDYGSLTIVRQENAPGGLQVRNKAGEWVPVEPVEGGFVVNIGDLMMEWTNDKWISTMHRVVNPPRDKALGSRRQSLVFFHQPNYDALVEVLPGCHDAANPPKYEPITSGQHLYNKFVKQTTFGAGM